MRKIPRWLGVGARELLYRVWVVGSRFGGRVALGRPEKLTVILRTYQPARARNLEPALRSLLKCDFVERVLLTNNNPEHHPTVAIADARLTRLDQDRRRGAGVAWQLAGETAADYVLVLDDDLLIAPRQVAMLFRELLARPEVPHGLAGRNAERFLISREGEVDTLFMAYAVSGALVRTYLDRVARLAAAGSVSADTVEFWADDIVISGTGAGRPRVHPVGLVRLCPTHNAPIAHNRQTEFFPRRREVRQALRALADTG